MTRLTAILALLLTPVLSASPEPVSVIASLIESAEPGSTVIVPAGVYEGSLRVNRPVVLDGRGRVTIDGGGRGNVVEIHSPGVTLRGFTVRGSGLDMAFEPAAILVLAGRAVIEGNTVEESLFGIDLRESPGSIIRGNTVLGADLEPGRRGDGVRLWWSHGCVIEDNTVRASRDMVFWYSQELEVRRNRVYDSRYGLHFMYSHDTTLSHNSLERNSVGVYLMYSNSIRLVENRMVNNRGASGYGVGLKDCDDITIERNAMLANRVGVYVDNSPSSFDSTGLFGSNMIAFNEIGMLATPNTHNNVFSGNAFIENEQQAATHGRGDLQKNTFALDGVGNFWSDYTGFDRDGDGIGDLSYEPRSLFDALLAGEPNLRLFVHSPAQQAVEFTARALPELRPNPTLVDPSPLASPPAIALPPGEGVDSGRRMAGVGLGLMVLAAGFWAGLGREPRTPGTAGRTER